jgi:hypothetical protein
MVSAQRSYFYFLSDLADRGTFPLHFLFFAIPISHRQSRGAGSPRPRATFRHASYSPRGLSYASSSPSPSLSYLPALALPLSYMPFSYSGQWAGLLLPRPSFRYARSQRASEPALTPSVAIARRCGAQTSDPAPSRFSFLRFYLAWASASAPRSVSAVVTSRDIITADHRRRRHPGPFSAVAFFHTSLCPSRAADSLVHDVARFSLCAPPACFCGSIARYGRRSPRARARSDGLRAFLRPSPSIITIITFCVRFL